MEVLQFGKGVTEDGNHLDLYGKVLMEKLLLVLMESILFQPCKKTKFMGGVSEIKLI